MSAQRPTVGDLLGSWSPDPVTIALLAAAALGYLLAMRRLGWRWPLGRTSSFMAGLAVLACALMSGLDGYAAQLLSVHMVQHLLLLGAPALLLAGAPVRLALAAGGPATRRALGAILSSAAGRVLGRPAATFVVFAAVVLATHVPSVFELALEDQAVHRAEHAAYFYSALLFMAPLIGADPLPHPLGAVARFCWSLAAMTVMAIPGALLTFAPAVRYPHYLAGARALGRSALADQQLAGTIMWVGGGLATFALALAVTLRALAAEERRQRRRELHARGAGAVGP